jgi:signal transduction histidine kinase
MSVLDIVPHQSFSLEQQMDLLDIGYIVSGVIGRRRKAFLTVLEQRASIQGGMTHNLRTPLNNMQLARDVMLAQVGELSPHSAAILTPRLIAIENHLQMVSSLINSSITVGKIFVENLRKDRLPSTFVIHKTFLEVKEMLVVSKTESQVRI